MHNEYYEILVNLLYSIKNEGISPNDVSEYLVKRINPEYIYSQDNTLLSDLYFVILHYSFGEEQITDIEFEYLDECIQGIREHNFNEKIEFMKEQRAEKDNDFNFTASIIENEFALLENRMRSCYEVITEWYGDHYVLDYYGNLSYKDCFGEINEDSLFAKQKYNKVTPYKMIRIARFYIMECIEYPNEVFRGTELIENRYEYDCCGDSLEEILDSL